MKPTIHILLFTLIIGFTANYSVGHSQSKVFFSKKKNNQLSQENKLIQQLNYADIIFNDSISKAIQIVNNTLDKAVSQKEELVEGIAYKTLGFFNHKLAKYDIALVNYDKALVIFNKKKNNSLLIKAYFYSALSSEAKRDFKRAITYRKKLIPLLNDTKEQVNNQLKTGDDYYELEDYDNASLFYEKALDFSKKSSSLENEQTKAEIGIAKISNQLKQYAKAKSILKNASKRSNTLENDELANAYYGNLSDVYQQEQNNEEYIQTQQSASKYNSSRGNNNQAIQNQSNIALNYIAQNRKKEAIEVLESSKEIAKKSDDFEVKKAYYKTLSTLYEAEGEQQKADKIKEQYDIALDSFAMNEANKLLALKAKTELLDNAQNKVLLLQKDRELDKKEIEILKKEQALQESTIKRQELITYALALGFFIVLVLSFFIYRSNKEKQISNQLLQLKSLRNQMNPHFIFNSLNSVNSFIAAQDERSANKYLAEFSKLMREVLEYSQEDFIPLSKEIQILELYLGLEHFRFKKNFDFTFTVDPTINQEDYQIPPMLLQPFIENAIWHGLRYKEEKGNLNVTFTQVNNHIEILITDDGIGRDASKAFKTANQKQMKSTGLKNVENRLEIIKNVFKKKVEITINDLNTTAPKGTKVLVKLS